MGNHIIKAARCALLPALQHIKTAASHGIWKGQKKKKKRNPSLRKSSLKQIESSPLGLGLTSSLTADCRRKTISTQIKYFFPLFPFFKNIAAAETNSSLNFFCWEIPIRSEKKSFDKLLLVTVISSPRSVLNYDVIVVLCWVITFC